MNHYDLIAFDMDGTLLNSEKKITKRLETAINNAVKAGKTIVISTGRALNEVNDYREILKNVRYFVCCAGAFIYDTFEEKIIYEKAIPTSYAEEILDIASNGETMFYIVSNGIGYIQNSQANTMGDYGLSDYQDTFERNIEKVEDIVDYFKRKKLPIDKLNVFNKSHEKYLAMREKINHLPLYYTCSEGTVVECLPENISKAAGLQYICEILDIPIERTIAVGDADNDIEIIKAAGLGIAMGNALEHVKAIADVIVADNNHDGCVEAIEKYLLDTIM